jgi:hypothetical protein
MTRESMLPGSSTFKLGSFFTFIVALASAPGTVAWFQDGDTKAEVAYEVLQAEVDYLKENNKNLATDLRTLRTTMIHMYTRPSAAAMPMATFPGTYGIGVGGGGGSGSGYGSGFGGIGVAPEMAMEMPPAAADGDADADEGEGADELAGVLSSDFGVPVEDIVEPPPKKASKSKKKASKGHPLESLLEDSKSSIEQRPALPDSLEALMQ